MKFLQGLGFQINAEMSVVALSLISVNLGLLFDITSSKASVRNVLNSNILNIQTWQIKEAVKPQMCCYKSSHHLQWTWQP